MTWHERDSIALAELIFYVPFTVLSALVCCHHGFARSSGWIYTHILCVVRIIGSICQFVSHHNRSLSLLKTVSLLDSVGLSPLLLATLGLLSRFIDFINAESRPRFTTRHFRIIQLVLLVGMVLAIVGGTNVSIDADGIYEIPSTSKIGVILYVVGFVGITFVFALSVRQGSIVPSKEHRVPIAITLALPFIFARLIYSVLSVFLHNHLFSVATGSIPVRIGMAVIEEFVVVAVYAILGLFVDRLDASGKGPIASRPWNRRNARRGHKLQRDPSGEAGAMRLDGYSTTAPLSRSQ